MFVGGGSMGWPFVDSVAYFNKPKWEDFAQFYNPFFGDQNDPAYKNPRTRDFPDQGQHPPHRVRTCRDCARGPSQWMQSPVHEDDRRRNCHGNINQTRSGDREEVLTRPSAVVPPRGNHTPSGRMKNGESSFPMERVRNIPVMMDSDSVLEREIPFRGTSNQQSPGQSAPSQPSETSLLPEESQQLVHINSKVTQPSASGDSLPNSNFSDENCAPTIPQMQLLSKIGQDLTDLDARIRSFQGKKSDREYLMLDELLTRALLSLDQIDSGGVEEVRVRRKKLVQYAYSLVEHLEGRFESRSASNAETEHEKLSRDNNAVDCMNSDDNAECDIDDDCKVGLANFIDL